MSGAGETYLSLVVTARNDDHGGNLLGRMQAFVDGWIRQANRHQIPSELIIVEWNPAADRPWLRDALRWPAQFGQCRVRIIQVPPEVHGRYAHAPALPLYQMIAKNAGIRRAHGRFVLATNIDILFSSELAAFLAQRQLEPRRMYRIDRYDVMSEVPAEASIEEQLVYCSTHLIRVNRREGTFSVSPDGRPTASFGDLAPAGAGILFGAGWYPVERYTAQEPFRWAGEQAEVVLEKTPERSACLLMDLEPGPGIGSQPLKLEVLTEDNRQLALLTIVRRGLLRLSLAYPPPRCVLFRARSDSLPVGNDPRVLTFRVFRLAWASQRPAPETNSFVWRPMGWIARAQAVADGLNHVVERLANGGSRVTLTVPVGSSLRGVLRKYLDLRGAPRATQVVPESSPAPAFLHTNACGDFTLMAREHWFDLRAYPEFDSFSMNLDAALCYTAHHGGARETMLHDPLRIYHIEHSTGTGWTPEGRGLLFERIAAKGIPFISNDEVLAWAAQMNRLQCPLIFNRESWGLADCDLPEITLSDQPA